MAGKSKVQNLRGQIDALDEQLLELLSQRAQCAVEMAGAKKNEAAAVSLYCPEREAAVLRRIRAKNTGPLSDEEVTRLFREIMSACLALEARIPVGFLGPEATFTHEAVLKHFGHSVQTVSINSIEEVFKQVEAGDIEYGVVPVENSTEGVVTHTLDCFIQSSLKISGEVQLGIHHNLIGLAENLEQIKVVYSHQQSFSQCRQWLSANLPQCQQIYGTSTAEAALHAQESSEVAAITSESAATRYKLKVLHANIEDYPDNATRFLIVSNHAVPPSGSDKTSILMSARNRSGALVELLQPLANYAISMTRIESRPIKTAKWEYVFFIDMDGHCGDESMQKVLHELEQTAEFFKLLGSYPQALL